MASKKLACRIKILTIYRGAYCAAVIITLLDLPVELPRDSPAWSGEGATLLTGLAEWVRRCTLKCYEACRIGPNTPRSNFRRRLFWPTRC
jgi:hypothetical protein